MYTQHQKNHLISTLRDALEAVEKLMPVTKGCHTCKNYNIPMPGGVGICKLVGVAPPPEIFDVGCESYIFDQNSAPF